MTSLIFTKELVRLDSELRNKNRNIILLIDNCAAHPDINSSLTNIKLVFFPPNVTSILQPLDQGVIRNFKHHYRKLLITKMLQALELKSVVRVSVLDALGLINSAWEDVTANTIKNCFVHSGVLERANENQALHIVANSTNETSDFDLIFRNAPEFFQTHHDLHEFFEIDQQIITREEFVENQIEEDDNTIETCAEDNFVKKISILEAIQGFNIVKEYYYQKEEAPKEVVSLFYKIEKDLDQAYLDSRFKQKSLHDYNIDGKTEK
ncbi:hypothetical protein ENBRE01_2487 [Enteropsectra breve]|nr:hypothetical protein ENBRE01_2487 [Enteropsectra breve]